MSIGNSSLNITRLSVNRIALGPMLWRWSQKLMDGGAKAKA